MLFLTSNKADNCVLLLLTKLRIFCFMITATLRWLGCLLLIDVTLFLGALQNGNVSWRCLRTERNGVVGAVSHDLLTASSR